MILQILLPLIGSKTNDQMLPFWDQPKGRPSKSPHPPPPVPVIFLYSPGALGRWEERASALGSGTLGSDPWPHSSVASWPWMIGLALCLSHSWSPFTSSCDPRVPLFRVGSLRRRGASCPQRPETVSNPSEKKNTKLYAQNQVGKQVLIRIETTLSHAF